MATASETAELLRNALSASPGVTEIWVDGIRLKVDKDALNFWEKRAAAEKSPNPRPAVATIDLSGGPV